MKPTFFFLAAAASLANALPVLPRQNIPSEADIRRLAPDLGAVPNQEPIGAECLGPVQPDGQKKRIPCDCPPEREEFLRQLVANVQAGQAVNNPSVKISFPTGDSKQDKKGRITAGTITIQNLKGPGVGCPNVATTFSAQSQAIDAGTDTVPAAPPAAAPTPVVAPAPVPAPPPSTPANNNGALTRDLVASLAPELGAVPNQEPIGTECLGPVQLDGQKKRIPCACPPTKDAFIDALFRDASLGQAANNPSVKVTFPTGDSVQDKKARITAGTIALQNLNGPGQGCPNVSTTFAAQSAALG